MADLIGDLGDAAKVKVLADALLDRLIAAAAAMLRGAAAGLESTLPPKP